MKRTNPLLFLTILLTLISPLSSQAIDLQKHPKVQSFINKMATKDGYKKTHLRAIFKEAKLEQKIIEKMTRPYEAKPWYLYKRLFVTNKRVKEGVEFWKEHEKTLTAVSQQYGVPASIIVAIIGVESNYGSQPYEFRIIDALTTLAFAYPRRSRFFKSELREYLLLTRERGLDPLSLFGSYAGAIGMPQFMPSSYRNYAVNYSGTDKISLRHNPDDAIASVGNYLKEYGWKKDGTIAIPATITGPRHKALKEVGLSKRYRVRIIEKYGIKPKVPLQANRKVIFVRLKGNKGAEYWLGLNNFRAITRYNNSKLYAMAVFELAQRIEAVRHHSPTTGRTLTKKRKKHG